MKKITLIATLFFASFVFAQTPKQVKEITSNYDLNALQDLYSRLKAQENDDKANVESYVLKQGIKQYKYNENGSFDQLMRIGKDGSPIYYQIDNVDAAHTTRVDLLNDSGANGLGLNLQGLGLTVGVWDGGPVLVAHNELTGRVTVTDSDGTLNNNSFHGTHVSGTIAASGVNAPAKGMAPQATIRSFDWTNDKSEVVTEIMNGLILSNHSYGSSVSGVPSWYTGSYNSETQAWDEIAYNSPYYLAVVSAGNDGNIENSNPTKAGYDKLTGYSTGKNNLVIANGGALTGIDIINPDGTYNRIGKNTTSSEGPADDGRIKPDITGFGTGVYSSLCDDATPGATNLYGNQSGTSMSAPNVTGSLLLVQEHYNNTHGRFMRAETIKALAINTADDITFFGIGPDADTGFGLLNTKACVEAVINNGSTSYITETVLEDQGTYTYTVNAIGGGAPLNVSVVWVDPAATWINDDDQIENNPRAALVNDLDVRVTEGANTYYPWKLSLGDVAADATRNSDNVVDNVEHVKIDVPAATTYIITVTHKGNLVNDRQRFALVVTGLVESSFTLAAQEVNDTQCETNDAVFNFDYKQVSAGTTTFTATNMPANMTVAFNNTTMNADGLLTATFGNFANVVPGEYNVYVDGTNGTDIERRNVFIKVYNSNLGNSAITNPVNGAANVNPIVIIKWANDFNATNYTLDVATDINFNTIIHTNNTTETSELISNLVEGQVYYVRVSPSNSCGTSTTADISSFQVGTPTDCIAYNGAGFAIPDNVTTETLSPLVIADDYQFSDLSLIIDYTHDWISDVALSLISPSGLRKTIINTNTCAPNTSTPSGSVFIKFNDLGTALDCFPPLNNYPTGYLSSPFESFADFSQETINGTWQLVAFDGGVGDLGTVNSWSIEACKAAQITPPNLIRNNDVTIAPLATHIYSNTTDLEVSSATETAIQQIFTLVELPTLGYLQLNTTTLTLGATFTQDDINNGNFKYVNTSSTLLAADATDTYTVNVLNNGNGWLANQKATINIDASLSVADNTIENAVIFPNPTSSNLTVVLPKTLKVEAISIIDVRGRLIKTFNSAKGNRTTINVADLESGAYFISIQTETAKTIKRFIKK